jgi:hypothetical protein
LEGSEKNAVDGMIGGATPFPSQLDPSGIPATALLFVSQVALEDSGTRLGSAFRSQASLPIWIELSWFYVIQTTVQLHSHISTSNTAVEPRRRIWNSGRNVWRKARPSPKVYLLHTRRLQNC